MKEIVLAALGVLGVAIPAAINLITGESRRVANMQATIKLLNAIDEKDTELAETKKWLRDSLAQEVGEQSGHRSWMVVGAAVIVACLASTYPVMQPPGTGHTASELRSVFILVSLVLYVVGAAVFLHGVHMLGRNFHLFSKP